MGFFDKIKANADRAQEEIEQKVNEKLDDEVLNPTLREHSGEPQGKSGGK